MNRISNTSPPERRAEGGLDPLGVVAAGASLDEGEGVGRAPLHAVQVVTRSAPRGSATVGAVRGPRVPRLPGAVHARRGVGAAQVVSGASPGAPSARGGDRRLAHVRSLARGLAVRGVRVTVCGPHVAGGRAVVDGAVAERTFMGSRRAVGGSWRGGTQEGGRTSEGGVLASVAGKPARGASRPAEPVVVRRGAVEVDEPAASRGPLGFRKRRKVRRGATERDVLSAAHDRGWFAAWRAAASARRARRAVQPAHARAGEPQFLAERRRPRPAAVAHAGSIPLRVRRLTQLRSACAEADLVHAHGLRAGLLAVCALGRRRDVPLVVTWYATEPVANRRTRQGSWASRWLRVLPRRRVARTARVVLAATTELLVAARRSGARDARLAPAPGDAPLGARHVPEGASRRRRATAARAGHATVRTVDQALAQVLGVYDELTGRDGPPTRPSGGRASAR